jgi:hypothetical protein
MRRRKLLLVLAGLAVVFCAAGAFLLWVQPSSVTRENCDRIKAGMSRAEVEAILGPPGDYTTGPRVQIIMESGGLEMHRPDRTWNGDEGVFSVWFDGERKVEFTRFHEWTRIDQSPLESLLWRVKRQWRKWFP